MPTLSLNKIKNFNPRKGPLLLIIMDGVGLGKRDESDGVFLAKTPCLDRLMKSPLYTTLKAHGTAVGMPSDADMGNSEVGHNALGAGRVFDQGATLVKNAIAKGAIFQSSTWKDLVGNVKQNNSTFHFISLLSDGNVHSHIDHLIAIVRQCAKEGVKKVRVHALLDGRDVAPQSALTYIEKTEALLSELNKQNGVDSSTALRMDYRIASGGGRMVMTMDRYNADWGMVEKGWKTQVLGEGPQFKSAKDAVEAGYALHKSDPNFTDQYLPPFVIAENGKPIGTIVDGDSVALLNFRGDRAMEISIAFDKKDGFDRFDRVRYPNVKYAGMMEYDGDLHIPELFLVTPPQIDKPVSAYMCSLRIPAFAVSETQKYGHVTYFWNGNSSGYVCEELEKYVEIPSDNISFDKAPKMKAYEITAKTIELMKSGKYRFGRINFPNGDMVGHTGVPDAIIASVEATDECVQKLIDAVNALGGITVVLADHGNADEMFIFEKGKKQISTAHSLNPVPCAIVDSGYQGEYKMADLKQRGLANVAATLLNLLGYEKPAEYEPSLITFVK